MTIAPCYRKYFVRMQVNSGGSGLFINFLLLMGEGKTCKMKVHCIILLEGTKGKTKNMDEGLSKQEWQLF